MSGVEVLTVGHSTHPIERFLELLQGAGVEAIADVRRYPGSRRHPQFGAEALRESLAGEGIAYEPFGEELGGRRRSSKRGGARQAGAPPPPDNSAWRSDSFRAYADHLATPEFEVGLERLLALAGERRTAVMCAEAHPSRCHRQLIADVLVARDHRVRHLLADGSLADHALSDHAVAEDGRVSYPGDPTLDV